MIEQYAINLVSRFRLFQWPQATRRLWILKTNPGGTNWIAAVWRNKWSVEKWRRSCDKTRVRAFHFHLRQLSEKLKLIQKKVMLYQETTTFATLRAFVVTGEWIVNWLGRRYREEEGELKRKRSIKGLQKHSRGFLGNNILGPCSCIMQQEVDV